jgi:hypothetical protein
MTAPFSTGSTAPSVPRSRFTHHALPLLTSLTFHATLLAIGLLTYQSVKVLIHRQVQATAGDTPLISPAIMTGLDDGIRGDQNDRIRLDVQDRLDDPSKGWNVVNGANRENLEDSFESQSNSDAEADSVIGPGLAAGRLGRSRGRNAEGGPMAPFGIALRGGGSNVFRSGLPGHQRPRSVAFLCDASGSMLRKFAALKAELSKAIQGLQPIQSFAIHFFTENRAISLNSQLVMATTANKLHALNFLDDVTPRGSTDPIPSLEMAFKQKPQLIFLLTDGDFPDNAAVLKRIRELNKEHRVRINTIAFVGEDDSDTAFITVLQQIARESGGIYRHVTEDELR